MFDDLTEYSIRADHQNLLSDSRDLLTHGVPGHRKHTGLLRRIASLVRRHRSVAPTPSVPAPAQPSSDVVPG